MIRRAGGTALGIGGAFTFAISVANIWAMLRVLGPAINAYLVAILPQALSVVVSGLQYRFSPAGFLGLAAYSVGKEFRLGVLVQSGTQVILGFESMDEWCVQLNVVAIFVGALVFSDSLKRWFADDPVESPPGTA